MRRSMIAPALAVMLAAAAGPALASKDEVRVQAPRDQWKSVAQITESFVARGFEVRKVKIEDGVYEVYAIDKDGKRIEAYVHPVTGEILKQGVDD